MAIVILTVRVGLVPILKIAAYVGPYICLHFQGLGLWSEDKID